MTIINLEKNKIRPLTSLSYLQKQFEYKYSTDKNYRKVRDHYI